MSNRGGQQKNNGSKKSNSQAQKGATPKGGSSRRAEEETSQDEDSKMNAAPDLEEVEIEDEDDEEEAAALARQYSEEEEESEESSSEAAPTNGAPTEGKKIDKRALPKGPRQVWFYCSANVENAPQDVHDGSDKKDSFVIRKGESDIVMIRIPVTMPPKAKDFFDVKKAKQEAITTFKDKFGVEPACVSEPTYAYLGEQKQPLKPRTSVATKDLADLTGESGTAIHVVNDIPWEVRVQFTEDENQVFAIYVKPVEGGIPPGKKRPQKPSNKGVLVSALQNLTKTPKRERPAASAN